MAGFKAIGCVTTKRLRKFFQKHGWTMEQGTKHSIVFKKEGEKPRIIGVGCQPSFVNL